MTRAWKTCLLIGVVGAWLGCGDRGGGGDNSGQQPSQPRPCKTGINSQWANDGTVIADYEPRSCPYTVKAVGSPVAFYYKVDRPTSSFYSTYGGPVDIKIWDYAGVERHSSTGYFSENHPSDPNKIRATLSGSYPGGYGSPPKDTVSIKYFDGPHPVAEAWSVLPGVLSTLPSQMIGANTVTSSQLSSWRAYPHWDTVSYLYNWYVDGSIVPGATGAVYATSFFNGQHTLQTVVTRSDYTSDTAQMVVKVALTAGLNGPMYVRPNVACTWNATLTGGVPPYHYSWTVDGNAVGSDQGYWSGPLTKGGHLLRVNITDSGNQAAEASMGITVDATQPVCDL